MSFKYGNKIKTTLGGGSHESAVSVYIEGIPEKGRINMDSVREMLARRAPGQGGLTSGRAEKDVPVILGGLVQTAVADPCFMVTGPIRAEFRNEDVRSSDYEKYIPRPGHGDYTAWVKAGSKGPLPGGGATSARMTVGLVFSGAISMQLLEKKGIEIKGQLILPESRHRCGDGDSFGGTVHCQVTGLPVGLGESYFGGLESRISAAVFAIPAVKAIGFGEGLNAAETLGSEFNDPFFYDENGNVKTRTNNCGGILAGMSDGMPLTFDAVFKPTPSISIEQDSVDLKTRKNVKLRIEGRHDRCVAVRAVPVVEAVTAMVIADIMAEEGLL